MWTVERGRVRESERKRERELEKVCCRESALNNYFALGDSISTLPSVFTPRESKHNQVMSSQYFSSRYILFLAHFSCYRYQIRRLQRNSGNSAHGFAACLWSQQLCFLNSPLIELWLANFCTLSWNADLFNIHKTPCWPHGLATLITLAWVQLTVNKLHNN